MAIKTKQDLAGKQDGAIGPWNLSDIANMDQTPLGYNFTLKQKGRPTRQKEERRAGPEPLAVAMRNANVLCS